MQQMKRLRASKSTKIKCGCIRSQKRFRLTGWFLGHTIPPSVGSRPFYSSLFTVADTRTSIRPAAATDQEGGPVQSLLSIIWSDEGQDIAEYAVMLAVILVIVVGTIRLVGSNANNAFSAVASSIH